MKPFPYSRLIWLVLLAIFCCAPALAQIYPPPEGIDETKYDRFSDIRTESLYQLQVAERQGDLDVQRLYLSVAMQFKSNATKTPSNVAILFTSWSLWNNRFISPPDLYSIIDETRVSYGTFEPVDRQVVNGKYVVTLIKVITYKEFQQIVTGKQVEMKLGDFEFKLTDVAQKRLRQYSDRARPYMTEP